MINRYLSLLADVPLPDPKSLRQPPSPTNAQHDPLIAHGWQNTAYIGAFILVLCVAGLVGFFSRRVEHALFAALSLSGLFIILFFIAER
jgi:hypothetical protein